MNELTDKHKEIIAKHNALPFNERYPSDRTPMNSLAAGLAVFLQYEDREIAAAHDVLYAGCSDKLTDGDVQCLVLNGWHYDTECDSWAFYT